MVHRVNIVHISCSQGQHGQRNMLEINQRFGMEPDISTEEVQTKLKDLQEQLKKDIRREMKIKEGAENLRVASKKDKKSLAEVNSIVKQANLKLERMNQELQEVNNFLVVTHTESSSTSAVALARRNSVGKSF